MITILTEYMDSLEQVTVITVEVIVLPVPKGPFRCFVCWQVKPPRKFGGWLHHKGICQDCRPVVGDWEVGCLIHFDRKFGHQE